MKHRDRSRLPPEIRYVPHARYISIHQRNTGFVCFFSRTFAFQLQDKPWSQVSSLLPPDYCLQFLSRIPGRVQLCHCSSIFHRVLLARALVLSASQIVHKNKSLRMYTRMHSGGLKLTKLTHNRLEDNLIRHRGHGPSLPPTIRVCIATYQSTNFKTPSWIRIAPSDSLYPTQEPCLSTSETRGWIQVTK